MRRGLRRLLWLYSVALFLAIAVLLLIGLLQKKPTVTVRDLPEIAREGVLHMAVEYNPVSYAVSGDSLLGFEYELSRLLASECGLEVVLHPVSALAESLEGLETGRYDIVGRLLPVTTENRELFAFTDPILLARQVLVQRKAEYNGGVAPIRNQLDLAGKRLYLAADTPTRLRIQNLGHEIGDTIYTVEEERLGEEQLIMLVARGAIDYAVCNRGIAQNMAELYPEIDIETPVSFTQFQAWSLRKDSPVLLDSLNGWLDRIRLSPAFQRIVERYYGD